MLRGLVIGVVACAAWPVAAPAAVADDGVIRSVAGDAAQRFWSPATRRDAKPVAPVAARQATAPRLAFHSSPVSQPSAVPFRTIGKLYLTFRRNRRWCSATVVESASDSVLLTAGHCLYDGRRWAKRLLFVPAFPSGRRTFGSWRGRSVVVPEPWHDSRNRNFDYGAVALRPSGGRRVGAVVGELPLAWDLPREQVYHAVGYPGNRHHGGGMWLCSSFYGYGVRDLGPGPAPMAIGCDMGPGSSGGPWLVQDRTGAVYLNSVTSFAIQRRPETIFGPYFSGRVAATVRSAASR